jgi:hypothetical protein
VQPTILLSSSTTLVAHRSNVRLARLAAMVSAFAVASFVGACSSDSSTGPSKPQVVGAYPMSTAQGMKVPHTFTDPAGSKLTIESGGLTMNSDGTFELKYKGRLNALTFNLTDEGTFTVAGSTVTFTPDDGDPAYTGRVSGKSIVVDDFKIAGVKWDLGFDGN